MSNLFSNPPQLIIGMFDETRIHLAGLKRMVELRGGLMADSIRQPSMLAAIITYVVTSPNIQRIVLSIVLGPM